MKIVTNKQTFEYGQSRDINRRTITNIASTGELIRTFQLNLHSF